MKTLDLIFFGLKGKINGPKALKELESLGLMKAIDNFRNYSTS